MKFEDWPNCPTPDCEHKVCSWAKTGLCYPCSERRLGVDEMRRRYGATHDADGELLSGIEVVEF